MDGTAPALQANLLWPLQHGQSLPCQASHSGQLPAVQVALRMHLEQQKSVAHWDKCFCELCTGQGGVSGWAIAEMTSYAALLHESVNKVWFSSIVPFNLKMKKQTVKEEVKLRSRFYKYLY